MRPTAGLSGAVLSLRNGNSERIAKGLPNGHIDRVLKIVAVPELLLNTFVAPVGPVLVYLAKIGPMVTLFFIGVGLFGWAWFCG